MSGAATGTVCSWHCVAKFMNEELEMIWKKSVVAFCNLQGNYMEEMRKNTRIFTRGDPVEIRIRHLRCCGMNCYSYVNPFVSSYL
jgi:hypothetical protein